MPPKRSLSDTDSPSRPSTPTSTASDFTPTAAPSRAVAAASKTKKAKADKAKAAPKKAAASKKDAEEKARKESAVEPTHRVRVKSEVMKSETLGATKKATSGGKDGRDKVKPVIGEEACAMMVTYLKEQNRPYSATDVSMNLHGKVTKTVADKLLKDLVNQDVIQGKGTNKHEKGSQWVFWATQNPADAVTPEQMAVLDAQISAHNTDIPGLKSKLKTLTAQLRSITSTPTTAEIVTKISSLEKVKEEKETRLQMLKDGQLKCMSEEEGMAIEKDWKYWGGKAAARKRAYREVEAVCVEQGLERESLREKIGFEEVGELR